MTDRDDPPVAAMTYDPDNERIWLNGDCVAHVDPLGIVAINGTDPDALGYKMAAADSMYNALETARNWLAEKYGPQSRRHDRSMWINQSAFSVYEQINAAMQQAEGE
jgi:hypothetical protein